MPNNKIPEQIVLQSQYVCDRYERIINSNSPISSQNAKSILYKIKEERADNEIEETFEALSYELFNEHQSKKNNDIEQLQDILKSIYENSSVITKSLCGAVN